MLKKNIIIDVSLAVLLLGSTAVQARLLLYEPFDYPTGQPLTGQGSTGMGMTETWTDCLITGTDAPDIMIRDGSSGLNWNGTLPGSTLPMIGGFAGMGTAGVDHFSGWRAIDPAVTATFVDGSVTWMSAVFSVTANPNHRKPIIAIAAGALGGGADRAQTAAGQGIGGGANHNDSTGQIRAIYWDDDNNDGVFERHSTDGLAKEVPQEIFVAKIEWGAFTDKVTVYNFAADGSEPLTEAVFDAATKQATVSVRNLDQSTFNTLSFAGSRYHLDEIRIGTTFSDVVSGTAFAPVASDPKPADEAADVPRDALLSWSPGENANTHDVYLGTVFDDVNDAGRSDPRGVLGSQNQTDTTYDPPGRLDFGQTYYWRIDEVNAPPDSTIFKGTTWSFTTEPVGYPVAGQTITVTASSADTGQGPENTVNGSGLADDLHSDELRTMWLTALGATGPAWIQYEFDRVYKLHQMWVWNHNGLLEPMIGFGCKEVTIEYSANGTDYTVLGTTHDFARAPGKAGYAHNTIVDFGGITAKYVRLTVNSNWGGILKQYGLSEVRFLSIPVLAREPNPASGAADVRVDATLNWRSGREAARHDVYLSADEQAVMDGTAPAVTVTEAGYAPSLDLAGTYYWRIDEVNDVETPTTWQGDIWSLSTQEYLVVDDFESYNDIDAGQEGSDLVYGAWIDGFGTTTNGSTIGYFDAFQPSMEKTVVYDGKQSVPLFYDNTTASVSEVTANTSDLAIGRDWTIGSPQTLVLWVCGAPANAPQQMYVKVGSAKMLYGGDIAKPIWTQWNIDLTALGINLSNVAQLSIGLERIGATGGSGMVLVDGIRLYRQSPPPPMEEI